MTETNEKLQALHEIADLLNEKLEEVRKSGKFQTALALAETVEKLENYIKEKETAQKKQQGHLQP